MTILLTCTYNLSRGLDPAALQEDVKDAVEAATFFWGEGLEVTAVPSPSPSVGFFSFEEPDSNVSLEKIYSDLSDILCQWDLPVEQFRVERR